MDAKFLSHSRSPFSTLSHRRHTCKPVCTPIHAVLTRPSQNITQEARKTSVYNDKWFDLIAINHLSQSVQAATGLRNGMSGYESLVEAARVASQKFNPIQQREVVIEALERAFPRPILYLISGLSLLFMYNCTFVNFASKPIHTYSRFPKQICRSNVFKLIRFQIRTLLPPSKFAREYFAAFTTVFFAWLVGPCEVRESEADGRREMNIVHIKKCRFLEETNCVGMCTNLCKIPSQTFIKDSFGIPVNMVPNFEDMSCQMIFGQEPLDLTDDPALKQPCYKLCKAKQKHGMKCSS
nr:beta-carotene isomerase d27, chloroplastic [Quercus suber]